MTGRVPGLVQAALVAHKVTVGKGPNGSATFERKLVGIVSTRPDGGSSREFSRFRQSACVVEVAVCEHDVSDVRPRRAHPGESLPDRRSGTGRTGVDQNDASPADHDETADLDAHWIWPDHPWRQLELGDYGLDLRGVHEARIARRATVIPETAGIPWMATQSLGKRTHARSKLRAQAPTH